MTYTLVRTSMALDHGTIVALDELSRLWGVSKAEVMRRAVRQLKVNSDREAAQPSPLQALDWLQNGGGLSLAEAEQFRHEVAEERAAKRQWWET